MIDEAIQVAAARTKEAQDVVADEIESRRVPNLEDVETALHRAEDLGVLTHERADSGGAEPEADKRSTVRQARRRSR